MVVAFFFILICSAFEFASIKDPLTKFGVFKFFKVFCLNFVCIGCFDTVLDAQRLWLFRGELLRVVSLHRPFQTASSTRLKMIKLTALRLYSLHKLWLNKRSRQYLYLQATFGCGNNSKSEIFQPKKPLRIQSDLEFDLKSQGNRCSTIWAIAALLDTHTPQTHTNWITFDKHRYSQTIEILRHFFCLCSHLVHLVLSSSTALFSASIHLPNWNPNYFNFALIKSIFICKLHPFQSLSIIISSRFDSAERDFFLMNMCVWWAARLWLLLEPTPRQRCSHVQGELRTVDLCA